MIAFRALEGSASRAAQSSAAMPRQGPPKMRRKAINAGEASAGTAPTPNWCGTNIIPMPTSVMYAAAIDSRTLRFMAEPARFLVRRFAGEPLPRYFATHYSVERPRMESTTFDGGNVNEVGSAQAVLFDSSHRPFTAERGAVTADSLSRAVGRR